MRTALLIAPLALAACAANTATTQPSTPCGAARATAFIGRSATAAVRQQVAAAVGHTTIRWIGPGDAVTMDSSEARLNAELDAGGKILGFRCG